MRWRPLLRPAHAFRDEPSDRLLRAPWLAGACGLALIAAGGLAGIGALTAIGVLVWFVGGALYLAVLVRAAGRSPNHAPAKSEAGAADQGERPKPA